MKTKLVRIGNSRGVRLPKPLIEEAGLSEDIELRVRNGAIIIARAAARPRSDWAQAAKLLHEKEEDQLLDPATPTSFAKKDWAR